MKLAIDKYFKRAAVAAICLSSAAAICARDYTNWMAELPDHAYISTLSIPGTHDSATGNGFSGILSGTYAKSGQTQDHTIKEQMDMGVRAFDFRPGLKSNRLRCYHGMAEINYWFDDAIRDICSFLNNHPSEFFIIHLYKSTDNLNKNLSDPLNTLISADDVKDHICSFRPDLTVADMRGKILFLKRYEVDWSSDKIAYLWDWAETGFENNEHFIKNMYEDQKCRIVMQDKANTDPNAKIDLFKTLFRFSSAHAPVNSSDMVWTLNFASSYNGSTSSAETYANNASQVCPAIIDMLQTSTGPTGVVLIDWVGDNEHKVPKTIGTTNISTQGETLVHAIADNNFRYLPLLYPDATPEIPAYTDRNLSGLVSASMFRGNMEWMDVSGNGHPDLVVKGRDLADGWWPKYHALYNDGNSLAEAVYLPRPGSDEWGENCSRLVVPIDYNADGLVDIIYGAANGSILLHNNGDGTFTPMENFTLYGQEIDLDANGDATIESRGAHGLMLTADFDLDGYPDILTYHKGDNNTDGAPFMYRNESRDFGCAFYGKNCGLPKLKNGSMAIGDYNGDGAPDVIISGINEEGNRQVSICINRGFNDYFNFDVITPAELQPYATDHGAVAMVDVNNDGLLDIFISGKLRDNDHIASVSASIFINNGDDTFTRMYVPATGTYAGSVDWCDINSDGYADIIYNGSTNYFNGCDPDGNKDPHYNIALSAMLVNNGDGTFHADNTTLAPLRNGTYVRAFDYNNSGSAAIALMGYGDNTFHIYEANGVNNNAIERDADPAIRAEFTPVGDNQVQISWNSLGEGLRYNYVIKLKDNLGNASNAVIAAVPVDITTGVLRQANIDAAPTGTSVTLNLNPDHIDSFGVQAITPDKKATALTMRPAKEDSSTDLFNVTATDADAPAEYFNLQGIRIAAPSGLCIERRGNRVTKRYNP